MKEDIATRWNEALESGEYKQNHDEHLKDNTGFCCLGVLCELAVKDGIISSAKYRPENEFFSYGGYTAILPPEVMDWAGMASETGMFLDEDENQSECLTTINDSGVKFPEIAKIIKDHWKEL